MYYRLIPNMSTIDAELYLLHRAYGRPYIITLYTRKQSVWVGVAWVDSTVRCSEVAYYMAAWLPVR